MDGKAIAIIIIIVVLLLIGAGVFFFLNKGMDFKDITKIFKKKSTPYAVEKNLEILSAKETYTNPAYPYTTDLDNNVIDVKARFEEASTTYNFYDYKVSDPDENGIVTVSFKYDMVVPLQYTREDYSYTDKYYYTSFYSEPKLFDYYTGEAYLYKAYEEKDENKEFRSNDIVFNDETTKVGVYTVTTSKWDPKENPSKDVYTATCRKTVTYYVSVPQGYDGLMISILKKGATKERFELNKEYNAKYKELKAKADETGEKSEEFIKMDEAKQSLHEILSSYIFENKTYETSDFYFFKVNDIKPAA